MSASQTATLRLLTALHLHRPNWAGSLLLGIGLNDTGRALALASLAVGAAALFLESDAAQLREANREGCCTFTVTTLEEALRALKNEVRQRRAITVAISGAREQWLAEMVERGVLPQAVALATDLSASEWNAVSQLQGWGATRLSGLGLVDSENAIDLAAGLRWQMQEQTAATMAQRRVEDVAMAAKFVDDSVFSEVSRLWLRAAPSLFPRALDRTVWIEAKS